jgi:hypothetical protein
MTKEEVLSLLKVISSAYHNVDMTDERTALWCQLLGDFPLERAQKHLKEHIISNHFPPTPADIIRFNPNKDLLSKMYFDAIRIEAFEEHMRKGGAPEEFNNHQWEEKRKHYELPDNFITANTSADMDRIRDQEISKIQESFLGKSPGSQYVLQNDITAIH